MTRAVKKVLKNLSGDQSGYVLFLVLFVLLIVSLVGVALIVVGTSEINLSARSRMMDQAYSIAEAGIDRAVAEVASNRDLANSRTGTVEEENYSLLWRCDEGFPGDTHGRYVASVSYDYENPSEGTYPPGTGDPFYKRIISTGTYTWGDKSVERTIEIKAYVPAVEQEAYDEAFDYCIFNGFNSRPDESGMWPSDDSNNPVNFSAGQFTFDGSTPYEGHAPQGALYTCGDLQLTITGLNGSSDQRNTVTVKGNVVATDDITVTNTDSSYSDMIVGEGINDKVVAGLDGTGDATVTARGSSQQNQKLLMKATLCAAQDIDIGGAYLLESYEIGNIKAGGNVMISRALTTSLIVGDILSAGKTEVESVIAVPITINSIRAGEYTGETAVWGIDGLVFRNLGVSLSVAASWPISLAVTGISPYNDPGEDYSIISSGELVVISLAGPYDLGHIKAGYGYTTQMPFTPDWPTPGPSETKRVGAVVWAAFSNCRVGDITSTGRVDFRQWLLGGLDAAAINTGGITAGTDAPEGTGGMGVDCRINVFWGGGISTGGGPVTAVGDVAISNEGWLAVIWPLNDVSLGNILSGANVDLRTIFSGFGRRGGRITTGTISVAGNVSVSSGSELVCGSGSGAISAEGSVTLNADDSIQAGAIASNSSVSLKSTNEDISINSGSGSIYARGNVSFECKTGSLASSAVSGVWGQDVTIKRNSGSFDGLLIGTIPDSSDSIRATGDVSLTAVSPDKISLSIVRMHTGETYTTSGTIIGGARVDDDNLILPAGITVTPPTVPPKPDVPQVNMLDEAGLSEPVRLPEPNWWHFMNSAIEDDKSSDFDPATPHMVYEGGPGDYDSAAGIQFEWNTDTYSSNEVIYSDNPSVPLYIRVLDWDGEVAAFTGTIVSKGPVIIDADGANWSPGTQHVLNIISGTDITFDTQGATGVADCHFHLYAVNNITFLSGIGLTGGSTFFGSFTAGNKVDIKTERLFENCTFKWSRWGLDPAGWLPAFKVLSWREI